MLTFSLLALLAATVQAQNAPVAAAQSVMLDEDKGKVITLAGSDADAGSLLSYIIVTPPAHGSLTGFGPVRVYSPEANYNGSDSFTFKVNDGALESPMATVSLTITPVEEAAVPGPAFSKFRDPNPSPNNGFGTHVVALNTGNVVITSPSASIGGVSGCGAVYLFNGSTGALISTLRGSQFNDTVGIGGVTALTNGNFVVGSYFWRNGTVEGAGAVTWGSGVTGVSGEVSAANSLVGSSLYDQVGSDPQTGQSSVVALANGNYVVICRNWNNGPVEYAGAVTWGSGSTGVNGPISTANSLVGTTTRDFVGFGGVVALANGNYVVRSYQWNNGAAANAGAVTWGSGSTGVSGPVSAANSLVGSSTGDFVGFGGVVALVNGHYVVRSDRWANGTVAMAGAVTWGSGLTGISGPVSAANSLVGTTAQDLVGREGLAALANGNYVACSAFWDNGVKANVGAITWGSGTTGITGTVSAANSRVGSSDNDMVGLNGVTALTNGNYVVCSSEWASGPLQVAGAATWGNGSAATSGVVSSANSLVGSRSYDQVGRGRVTALANGHYVVSSPYWKNGSIHVEGGSSYPVEAGAATWGDGSTGITGTISAANSIVGAAGRDRVSLSGVTALANGNYVVCSQSWRNNGVTEAGAVTWGNGSTGSSGVVSAVNSLVGTTVDDQLGKAGVTALTNGNYVVFSPSWDHGATADVGAVTWGSGVAGITGTVSAANSLLGSSANDKVGAGGVTALTNGNYVVRSQFWKNGSVIEAGAVTWGSGSMGISGAVSLANSHVGVLPYSILKAPALDPVNNHFINPWASQLDGDGKARLGSQENGFMPAPEMNVFKDGTLIANQDSTPSVLDGTDFSSVVILNTLATRVFTISNAGNLDLNLTGGPRVAITGEHAADFSVTQQPGASVGTGASTTFAITFDPSLPGQRNAMVSIISDDASMTPYTFAITGFGALPAPLAQSIVFSPPATLYIGQSPFPLTATASSGMPVTFTVVSGPATISDDLLELTGLGNVVVRASQPGGNNYAAAPALTKTIAVKANPTALTLLDLAQTYDGTPRAITTIGALNPVITYSIGGVFGATPPTNAGSYPVKAVAGSISKTGTLVIAKAILSVVPDNKQKFAGQPNPPLTAVITGFIGTDDAAVLTKPLVLTTTAKSTSPGGTYNITASAAAALNYNFSYQPGTLVVESFAASYEALLMDAGPLPVAKLSIAVPSTSTAFTAKLQTASEASAVSFAGPLVTNPAGALATGTATTQVKVGGVNLPYVISFTLPLTGNVTATATRDGTTLGSATDGRRLWVPAKGQIAAYAGAHTVVLEPATPAAGSVPAGAGWATATISTAGIMTLAGRLGDGTTLTSTLSPDVGPNPGYRLFSQPYTAPRAQSYIAGAFVLAPHPNPTANASLTGRRYVEQAGLTWKKSGLVADASYRTNFGPVSTVLLLDPWLPPTAAKGATPAVTLAERLGLPSSGTSFAVTHSETGSAAQPHLPVSLGLSATNTVSVLLPVTSPINRTKWKILSLKTTDGTFTGSFELSDVVGTKTVPRTVTFSGVLRQPALGTDTLIGDGHYLAPPLTGTERTTGEVMLTRP